MKENNERIEGLLERYFAARTTDTEERELRAYFRQGSAIPEGLRYAQTLFDGMDALSGEVCPPRQEVRRPARLLRRGAWPLWAAAAAVVVGVFFSIGMLRQPYCYIDGVAVYDKQAALQTTLYLDAFSEFEDPAAIVDELIIK